MEILVLGLLLVTLMAAAVAFLWVGFQLKNGQTGKKDKQNGQELYSEAAERDVEHIFNDAFREELRNRGRLHFEKIIGENAMFLQQDLRLTTSQLNEYMKGEITRTLKDEFTKYEQSLTDAKQLAIDSISKTQEAIEQQRVVMAEQLQAQFDATKAQLIERFEKNTAEIVNHYIMLAVGNQIDLGSQLDYIISDLEANKQAIIEDIANGA